jgi:hypothetical protein
VSASSDIDLSQFNAGIGYHYGLSDRADLVTELSYVRTDVDVEGDSMSADDARIALGVRGLLADSFEGWVKGNYTDGDAYDGEFSATVGGQFSTRRGASPAAFGDSTSHSRSASASF